ncbi:glutathione S-transferase N-terminal domain-containing protein [Roseibium sp. Sym1]|uniref:glutathione S-transferase N-terminal domain-containing protein n=1 Tax=Roseibium sp. Sym1 TaxID=3016006 RepID=UPI0022B31C32|nr:glutathione S-transferase N-terminal domain-containing protein [Roseibium sp. Sym1]
MMTLYFANTSPYARKARMVVLEKGLEASVEMVFQNPFEDSPALKSANPLGKVPALVTGEGTAIYDSPVICAYLDSLPGERQLIPEGTTRWKVLTAEALADGILDAAFAIVMERRRDATQQSPMWLDRWQAGILRPAAVIEADLTAFEGPLSLAQIALGAALGYLDFRLPDIDWRPGHPQLAAWFETFSERPAMRATDPAAS